MQGVRPTPTLLCCRNNLVQISALCSLCAAALPHQDLARHTAAFVSLILGSRSHVIVGHDRLDGKSGLLCHLDCHLDVHVVAGIIAVEAGHASAAVSCLECIKECSRCRRRADLAHCRCIAEIFTDVADESRLMARAAARHHTDFAGDGSCLCRKNTGMFCCFDNIAMCLYKAFEHLVNDVIGIIQNALHNVIFLL